MEMETQAQVFIGNVYVYGMELFGMYPRFDGGIASPGGMASCCRWGDPNEWRTLLCEEYEFGPFDLACVCFSWECVALALCVFVCCKATSWLICGFAKTRYRE